MDQGARKERFSSNDKVYQKNSTIAVALFLKEMLVAIENLWFWLSDHMTTICESVVHFDLGGTSTYQQ